MGSSVSSDNKSNGSSPSRTPPTMQKSVTHQVIPSCGPPSFQSALNPPRPLKGILKNKNPPIAEKPVEIAKPVKIVELYVLRGSEWSVTRVREVRNLNCLRKCILIKLYLISG